VERANILRQILSETGVTQTRLSELSGVKQSSLSQMLHGRIEMSDDMLSRLLSCLGYRLEVVRRPVRVELDRSNDRRWRMHERLARQLSSESWPHWRPTVQRNLKQLRALTKGEPHASNLERWSTLVASNDLSGIRRAMTGLDAESIGMREVSPLGGLLSEQDRLDVLAGAKP